MDGAAEGRRDNVCDLVHSVKALREELGLGDAVGRETWIWHSDSISLWDRSEVMRTLQTVSSH